MTHLARHERQPLLRPLLIGYFDKLTDDALPNSARQGRHLSTEQKPPLSPIGPNLVNGCLNVRLAPGLRLCTQLLHPLELARRIARLKIGERGMSTSWNAAKRVQFCGAGDSESIEIH